MGVRRRYLDRFFNRSRGRGEGQAFRPSLLQLEGRITPVRFAPPHALFTAAASAIAAAAPVAAESQEVMGPQETMGAPPAQPARLEWVMVQFSPLPAAGGYTISMTVRAESGATFARTIDNPQGVMTPEQVRDAFYNALVGASWQAVKVGTTQLTVYSFQHPASIYYSRVSSIKVRANDVKPAEQPKIATMRDGAVMGGGGQGNTFYTLTFGPGTYQEGAILDLQIDGEGLAVVPHVGAGQTAEEFAEMVYDYLGILGYIVDLSGNTVILRDPWDEYSTISMEWLGSGGSTVDWPEYGISLGSP
jgi:hypothetical protein